jgi:hypothetical protein
MFLNVASINAPSHARAASGELAPYCCETAFASAIAAAAACPFLEENNDVVVVWSFRGHAMGEKAQVDDEAPHKATKGIEIFIVS